MMAISIMGAMRMIPNDLLNAHTDLYPVPTLANEICFRATARYMTLEKEHPLHKPMQRMQRYVKNTEAHYMSS